MRKIVIKFTSSSDVKKLKQILKQIYTKNNEQIKELAEFVFTDEIIPQKIERAELELFSKTDVNKIIVPKEYLSFMIGDDKPFTKVRSNETNHGKYKILPWNLDNRLGLEFLRNIISKISSKTKAIKYTVFVNNEIEQEEDSAREVSISQLSLSELSYDDDMGDMREKIELLEVELARCRDKISKAERLLEERQNRIEELTSRITDLNAKLSEEAQKAINLTNHLSQKQAETNSLTLQNTNLTSQRDQLQQRLNAAPITQSWRVVLPSTLGGNITIPNMEFGSQITGSGITSNLSVAGVNGNVMLNIPTRTLTIGGSSCGVVNGY